MESSPLLDPSVLFILGLFAGLVRSNLEVPGAIARFFVSLSANGARFEGRVFAS